MNLLTTFKGVYPVFCVILSLFTAPNALHTHYSHETEKKTFSLYMYMDGFYGLHGSGQKKVQCGQTEKTKYGW